MRAPGLSTARIKLKLWLKTGLAMPGHVLRSRQPGLRVLFYHRVNPYPRDALGPVSREISVDPSAFARQLAWLAENGYRTLSLADAEAVVSGRAAADPKAILITFDDGYEDNLLFAAPLLARHGFTATVFVVSDFMGKSTDQVWPYADPPALGRFLSADQVRALLETGLTVGSHTVSHPMLTTVAPDARRHELVRSREALGALIGAPVTALAYPGGDCDAAVERDAEAAGYTLAFTTVPGVNRAGARRTALRRTEVSASDSPFVFRMKLKGTLDWLSLKETAQVRGALRVANRLMTPLAR